MAVLRGKPGNRLRLRRAFDLPKPSKQRRGRPVLQVQAHRQGRPERDLSRRQLVVSGLSFEFAPTGGIFPAAYQGALFFADYSRDCIWVMRKNGNPSRRREASTLSWRCGESRQSRVGPDGALYYVDFDGGTIRRIAPTSAPPPPPPGTTFGQPTHYATGTNAHGATLANLNGDGSSTSRSRTRRDNVTVRLGNGDGSFGPASNFATGTTPKSVAIADLNADGNQDLVTADQDSNTASVLLGNGNGTFGAKTSYPVCAGTHEPAIGNFNGDGRPDIALACWGGSVISVLLNSGNGTSEARSTRRRRRRLTRWSLETSISTARPISPSRITTRRASASFAETATAPSRPRQLLRRHRAPLHTNRRLQQRWRRRSRHGQRRLEQHQHPSREQQRDVCGGSQLCDRPRSEIRRGRRFQRRRELGRRDGEHRRELPVGCVESRRRPGQPPPRKRHGRVRRTRELPCGQHAVLGRGRPAECGHPA